MLLLLLLCLRRMVPMSKYKINAEPITAVHIGTGNTLSPLEYYIVEKEENFYELNRFKTERIISSLSKDKRQTFEKLLDENDIIKIQKFINNNINDDHILYSCQVSKSVYLKYKEELYNMDNQLLIEEIYRDQRSFNPVIPGSSIKGAIRTAILSKLGETINRLNPRYPEKDILGFDDAKNDPFRGLQISDCEIFGNNKEYVSDFINFKENRNNSDDFASMQMFNEQIRGEILKGDANGTFEVIINEKLLSISISTGRWNPIKLSFSITDIMLACNNFYAQQFENEFKQFYEKSKYQDLREQIELIKERINYLKDNECIIRLGKFSQVESVTINKHRNPWNTKGFGKTRTLTEEKFPIGWLKLRFEESVIKNSQSNLFS